MLTDPTAQALLEFTGTDDLYACVDLAADPDALRWIDAREGDDALCLFDGVLSSDARRAAPWLVRIAPMDDTWRLEKTGQLARRAAAVTWIVSSLSLEQLRTRLANRLDVKLGDGAEFLLRYFDPRILEVVLEHLDPAHSAAFLALGSRWCWIDRDGSLRNHPLNAASGDDPVRVPTLLTASEEAQLVLATEAGQLLTQALTIWPQDLEKISGKGQFALARRTCQEADSLDMGQSASRLQLLLLASSHGAGYYDSPLWATHRERIGASAGHIAELLAQAPNNEGQQ